jgi:hypothetical protein
MVKFEHCRILNILKNLKFISNQNIFESDYFQNSEIWTKFSNTNEFLSKNANIISKK